MAPVATVLELDTPQGAARAHLHPVEAPVAALALGHGAGGGVAARDLVAVTRVANELDIAVALVEQPYRVAGRRSPPPAPRLDEAWLSVLEQLRAGELAELRVVVGGRSSGARVACRTAAHAGAIGVLCLAFPLHPPGRREKTRLPELDAVEVPTLVIQGERDPFGMPPGAPNRTVVPVPGTHTLSNAGAIGAATRGWLAALLD